MTNPTQPGFLAGQTTQGSYQNITRPIKKPLPH